MTWDLTKPADSRDIDLGPADIRELKTDIQTALQVEHTFPGTAPANPKAYHKVPYGNTASRPAAGNANRWYYNTDTATIQRDTGSAWESITPAKGIFPAGTKTIFGQAAAPTGWTKDTTYNDAMLRVVSGAGGGAAGSWTMALDNNSHTHNAVSAAPSGAHVQTYTLSTNSATWMAYGYSQVWPRNEDKAFSDHDFSHIHAVSTAYVHNHSLNSWRPQYVDVIICTKD